MFKAFFSAVRSRLSIDPLLQKNLFPSEAHEEMVGRMVHAAENRCFALCTGEVGAGKSTAARAVSDILNPTRYLVLYITDSDLTPRNFYYEVLHQLGIQPRFYRGDAKRQLVKALMDMHESNRRVHVTIPDMMIR